MLPEIIEGHFSNQNQNVNDERSSAWQELIKKNIFESYIEIKELDIKACIQHWKYPNELEVEVWRRRKENSKTQGYKKVGVKYLLQI